MGSASTIIDLSHNLDSSTQVYPGAPKFSSHPVLTIGKNGFNVMGISLSTHTGTHIDVPSHFIQGGTSVPEMNLALFQGPALVIDVRGKKPRAKITWEDLKSYAPQMQQGKIVVLYTGWSQYWKSPKYFEHPFLDRSAAEGLIKAGIRTVATDCLSLDETFTEGMSAGEFVAHKIILSHGGVIGENLTNVGAIAKGNFTVSMMPLKVTGGDGSPARAVAWST